ncbi:DUF305 domain-containing protein (plasmid) [Rhizobium lusitanum]|nr:DUF305 domain-containing protein [Rhizobium lusitanum]
MKQSLLLASAILLFAAPIANAEDSSFPEVCKSDVKVDMSADHSRMMTGMMTEEHQKAGMTGMMQMDKDMMHKDPDVAFVCGMIAHHMGAIDMSKVELKNGKNAWTKDMARKVIDAQTREIADMTEWLKTNAK